ncbi:hypothetical protein HD554DRAFT_2041973 [Boletus coccyginus]|nr:hypothetical protein HD554DRAFT_2041973 [Boletus coccyginus]
MSHSKDTGDDNGVQSFHSNTTNNKELTKFFILIFKLLVDSVFHLPDSENKKKISNILCSFSEVLPEVALSLLNPSGILEVTWSLHIGTFAYLNYHAQHGSVTVSCQFIKMTSEGSFNHEAFSLEAMAMWLPDDYHALQLAEGLIKADLQITSVTSEPLRHQVYTSDQPLLAWIPHHAMFLDELICHEGWCASGLPSNQWNGVFFMQILLKSLELHIQLGHTASQSCIRLVPACINDNFFVINTNSVHEQFHILSFESKASTYEYYSALDCYEEFVHIIRLDGTATGFIATKHRNVSADAVDPNLNGGSAFFVEENAFKTYLLLHAADPQEYHSLLNEEEYVLWTYCCKFGIYRRVKTGHVDFAVPKFHLPIHKETYQLNYSFNFIPCVEHMDGEALERGWANINPAASSTKEMGPGFQRDILDDFFGDWNWKKTIGLSDSLLTKMKEAVMQKHQQHTALQELEAPLPPGRVFQWTAEVEA